MTSNFLADFQSQFKFRTQHYTNCYGNVQLVLSQFTNF